MESRAVLFCVVVGVLGIISAIVGFVGEATRVKVTIKINKFLNYHAYTYTYFCLVVISYIF